MRSLPFLRMRSDVSKVFRVRLRQLRDAMGLTQQQLEDKIGKIDEGAGYISRVETGRIVSPPFEVVNKLADALNVDPVEFFSSEGLDDDSEELLRKIQLLLSTKRPDDVRKAYRLLLVTFEKY